MTKRDITTKRSTPKFTDGMGPCASRRVSAGMVGFKGAVSSIPRVSIVVPFLVNQNLYYRILTIKLVNQKKELQWRL